MDLARASDQIDRLIERRATQNAAESAREELWRASVRRYHQRNREEHLREHLRYHQAMLEAHSRSFEVILRRHRVGIRLVEQALGIDNEQHDERKTA